MTKNKLIAIWNIIRASSTITVKAETIRVEADGSPLPAPQFKGQKIIIGEKLYGYALNKKTWFIPAIPKDINEFYVDNVKHKVIHETTLIA